MNLTRGVLILLCLLPCTGHAASVCIKKVCIDVEVMRTPQELSKGLQGRDGLADNQGMLFVFDREEQHRFWMKGMRFAIDILWIDAQGRIVFIAPSCPPCMGEPCAVYGAPKKARYVLELVSGSSTKHQLKVRDKVILKDIH